MKVFEEEWVNSENHIGDRMISEHTTLALVVLGINSLFLRGLQILQPNLIAVIFLVLNRHLFSTANNR